MPRQKQDRNVIKARALRQDMTLPEVLLWRELRKELLGVKFRRQHPVGPYVLDFYCSKAKLAIEVDGIAHDMGERPERDSARTVWLREQGIDLLRIAASDVLKSVEEVADSIGAACRKTE